MPLQNRVTPLSELIADAGRGLVFGNRGCLHDDAGRIRRRYAGKRWIACRLEFGRRLRRPLLQPHRYTELFFLDEATAFSAGHRPCAECRHDDYRRFIAIWDSIHGAVGGADAIDARLHDQRLDLRTGSPRHHIAPFGELPDGVFVVHNGAPHLVRRRLLLRWSPSGYETAVAKPTGSDAEVITPQSLVAVIRSGWVSSMPLVHPSAAAFD